ncbi:hypothetical protein QBC41DRAFT_374664 [Cercophora samala]|uniref:Uncharacterized protein n=1 Tax=Cercophora samala TaxID=330535 RepID=A0AA40D904_9PEZI|nr:hypothetical protein QBC41DRAFT_374664 [Cercophora samala]
MLLLLLDHTLQASVPRDLLWNSSLLCHAQVLTYLFVELNSASLCPLCLEIDLHLLFTSTSQSPVMCLNVRFKCPTCGSLTDYTSMQHCEHNPCVGRLDIQIYPNMVNAIGNGVAVAWYCPNSSCLLSYDVSCTQDNIFQSLLEAQHQGRMGEQSLVESLPAMRSQYGNNVVQGTERVVDNVSTGVDAPVIGHEGSNQGPVGAESEIFPRDVQGGQGHTDPGLADYDSNPSQFQPFIPPYDDTGFQEASTFTQQDPSFDHTAGSQPTTQTNQYGEVWTIPAVDTAQVNQSAGSSRTHASGSQQQWQQQQQYHSTAADPPNVGVTNAQYPPEWRMTPDLSTEIDAFKAQIAEQTRDMQPREKGWVEAEVGLLLLLKKRRPRITYSEISRWFIPRHSGTACESAFSRRNREDAARRVAGRGGQ